MNNKNTLLILIILMVVLISACTPYEYEPTSDVVYDGEGDEPAEETINLDELLGETEEVGDEVDGLIDEVLEDESDEVEDEREEEAMEEVAEELFDASTPQITVIEGDLVDLKPYVMDPDGDTVELGYTEPFDANGMWQTNVGDAGFYSVIVTATDNKDSFVTKQMKLTVLVKNKAPVINIAENMEFDEGDLIKLNPDVYDPDNDEVVVIYSGWMNSKNYQTNYDDAGKYVTTIRADDGKEIVSKDVQITVNDFNRVPEVSFSFEDGTIVTVVEGDLVEVTADAKDLDGDDVEFSYSTPLDGDGKWQTARGDAGFYDITVTATDGANEVVSSFVLVVEKKNTAPTIDFVSVTPEYVELKKPGDKVTIKINVEASDVDGNELTISYSGFMESNEKTVAYGEKGGLKTVTVTVSDGTESVSKDVSFDMNNWPCFDCME